MGNFDGNSSPIEMHSRHYTSLVRAGQISNLTAAFPFQTLNAVNFSVSIRKISFRLNSQVRKRTHDHQEYIQTEEWKLEID